SDELVDEPIELVVAQHRNRAGHAFVEDGMVTGRQGFGPVRHVRPGEPSRVRELQPETEVRIRIRSERCTVRGNKFIAQGRYRYLITLGKHQLVRTRPAVVPHRNGLTTPDELRSAHAKPPPPPSCVFGGPAVELTVPPFHRKHTEAVTD